MQQPTVKPLIDGKSWELMENYIYALNDGRTLFIPRGFIFDFASIPRIAWRLFPPATGKHRTPALIHDHLCANGSVSWQEAAEIFLQAMKVAGVSYLKRYTIYWSVRAFEPLHTTDARQEKLRMLQKLRLEECTEHYSNVI